MFRSVFNYGGKVASMSTQIKRVPLISVRMASNGKFDFVVFGATGFTGQYVVEEVARVAALEKKKLNLDKALSFAIAGRSKSKLLKSVEEAKKVTGLELTDVGIIEADVSSEESINSMTKQAKVVINCVGPYIKYGEIVVKSCIENGANHVDISGEPSFLECMQLKYNKAAEEKGVHIVGACGYDSVPPESGLMYLEKLFPGGLNSVEHYSKVKCSTGRIPAINTGTLESAMILWSSKDQIIAQRKKLFPTRLPKSKYRVKNKGFGHYNPEVGCHGVPFPSDEPVVQRTQQHRCNQQNLKPIQYSQYFGVKSYMHAVVYGFAMAYLGLMAMFTFTRNLVVKYPSIMTAGVFSRGDIDKEALKHTSFIATFVAKGWKEPLLEASDEHASSPDVTKVLKIHGPDPGYGATSLMLVACAMTILREKQQCCQKGGVLTPGITFAKTSLIERLTERGMKFELKE